MLPPVSLTLLALREAPRPPIDFQGSEVLGTNSFNDLATRTTRIELLGLSPVAPDLSFAVPPSTLPTRSATGSSDFTDQAQGSAIPIKWA